MSRRFSIIALLTASLFLCLMAGCWNPFKPDKKDGGGDKPQVLLPRTSPENVLFDFRVIYGDKDNVVNSNEDAHNWAEAYRSLFSPDTFKFYFLPGDYNVELFPEGWWGTNDEATSFERMFQLRVPGVVVEPPLLPIDDIQLNWTSNASEPDNRTDTGGTLLHPTWRHINVTGILLDVIQGANTTRVPNGSADFYFSPDPANPSLWVITEWIDRQPAGGLSPPISVSASPTYSSWGRIKTLY